MWIPYQKESAMSRHSGILPNLILTLVLLFLPACGLTNKKMDPVAAHSIHTITLLDVSVTPTRTYLDTGASTLGSMLADVGTIASDFAVAVPQSALQKAIPGSDYASHILSEELAAALQRKGFTIKRIPDGPPSHRPSIPGNMNNDMFVKDCSTLSAAGSDAILDPVCVAFGYQRFEFTQSDHPMIILGVRLVSPDGKTIYYTQGFAFTHDTTHQNNVTNIDADRKHFTAPWSEIFADPKRLDDQLRFAARSLADAVAKDIAAGQ
jgi:hypothetical protein